MSKIYQEKILIYAKYFSKDLILSKKTCNFATESFLTCSDKLSLYLRYSEK